MTALVIVFAAGALVGGIIGATIGVLVMACCCVAGRADDGLEV